MREGSSAKAGWVNVGEVEEGDADLELEVVARTGEEVPWEGHREKRVWLGSGSRTLGLDPSTDGDGVKEPWSSITSSVSCSDPARLFKYGLFRGSLGEKRSRETNDWLAEDRLLTIVT